MRAEAVSNGGAAASGLLSVFREAQGRRLECSGVAFALHTREVKGLRILFT